MRKPIIVAAAVLLMVLAMAADSTPAGTGAGIVVDPAAGVVSFGGTLQEPAITTVPRLRCWTGTVFALPVEGMIDV